MDPQDSKATKEVSILVVNWNVSDLLVKCIDSVLATAGDTSYEMFVIDNASSDMDFGAIARQYEGHPHLTFIANPVNEGVVVMNRVLDRLQGRYVLILGPDTVMRPGTLRSLVDFMDRTQAGAASAKLINPDGSPQMYYYRFWDPGMVFWVDTLLGRMVDRVLLGGARRRHYFGQDLDVNAVIELEQPPSVCLLVRGELLAQDGCVIDPDFPLYFCDVDLCRRIWSKGYRSYLVPQAEIVHDQSSSLNKANPLWARLAYLRSQLRYFEKWHPEQLAAVKALVVGDIVLSLVLWPVLELDRLLTGRRRFRKTTFVQEVAVLRGLLGGEPAAAGMGS